MSEQTKQITKGVVSGYRGFEQGPIRPPSEAESLLVRVTRNCHWNRCAFCPVYKGAGYSVRPVEDVIRDIDAVYFHIRPWLEGLDNPEQGKEAEARRDEGAEQAGVPWDEGARRAAWEWRCNGGEAIFLQDADALAAPPKRLLAILQHLRLRFPRVKRITSYARSETINRRSSAELREMALAGLNRIHAGMESGSSEVLARVCKGATKESHIRAGLKVKAAGMELSEYIMPGLGGRELWESHARETAEALNEINPDFIRLRTLAVPRGVPLNESWQKGAFHCLSDVETARELLLLLQNLENITSTVTSDHMLNLFQDVNGVLPGDKEKMMEPPRTFLALSPAEQCLFQVGARMGMIRNFEDLKLPRRREQAEAVCQQWGITPDNVDEVIRRIMAGGL